MLFLILLVAAFVLFLLAALNVPSAPRLSLGWAGAACATRGPVRYGWPLVATIAAAFAGVGIDPGDVALVTTFRSSTVACGGITSATRVRQALMYALTWPHTMPATTNRKPTICAVMVSIAMPSTGPSTSLCCVRTAPQPTRTARMMDLSATTSVSFCSGVMAGSVRSYA